MFKEAQHLQANEEFYSPIFGCFVTAGSVEVREKYVVIDIVCTPFNQIVQPTELLCVTPTKLRPYYHPEMN